MIKKQEILICWLLLPLLCENWYSANRNTVILFFKNSTFFTRAHPRHYIPFNKVNHFIYPLILYKQFMKE